MSKRVLVAISGGTDSAVAAALLKTQGFDVVGLHLQFWDASIGRKLPHAGSCFRWIETETVQKLAEKLEIPLHVVEAQDLYFGEIVDYVVHDYLSGRLPNPCVRCNSAVKFSTLIAKADELHCDLIATGHYAKVVRNANGAETNVYRAADRARDQSYYLFDLPQSTLARTLMPLGDLLESNILKMARTFELPVGEKRASGQSICFVDTTAYRDVVESRTPDRYRPGGPIVDREGTMIGRHVGLYAYRIGQKRPPGIDRPELADKYVIGFDVRMNGIIVGDEKDLYQAGCVATGCNWIGLQDFTHGVRAKARFRSHQAEDAPCTVTLLNNNSMMVEFEKPQLAIIPGQALALYQDDILIGGGWIDSLTTPIASKLNKRQAFTIAEKPDKKKKK